MPAESRLSHKLGPLKLWQWLLVGGGIGGIVYIWEKDKSAKTEELSPSEENALLNALGGGVGSGGANIEAPKPTETKVAEAAVPGAPGVAGAQGEPGAPGASPAQSLEKEVAQLNSKVSTLEQYNTAPQARASSKFNLTNKVPGNPRQNQKYRRIKNSKGQTVDEYVSGQKIVVAGSKTSKERAKSNSHHAAKQGKTHATKKAPPKRVAPVHHSKPVPVKHRVTIVQPKPVARPAPAPKVKVSLKSPEKKKARR